METNLYLQIVIVFLASMVGGTLALVRQWSDSLLHLFISLGAGIILGVVFLHLLPESIEGGGEAAALPVLVGFLLIFFVEKILLSSGQESYDHNHRVISITVFLGLSVHSLFEGVGLAVGAHESALGSSIFVSVIAHKLPAAFALASLFVLGRIKKRNRWLLLALFSLSAPVGALLFSPVLSSAGVSLIRVFTGVTAGTFLYIATGDLLPEVFHTREKRWFKLALLISGIVFMTLFGGGHEGH
ncbi:MAG: ZIP family metal transporter [bacterium]|nr:ZIP family metal transporter [bacterium]